MRRLLIRPGAIGDIITSLPALECLRGDYTEVWAPSPVVPLIRFADQVRSISSTGLDRVEISGQCHDALERLREFDSIVSWYGSAREEFREAVRELPFRFFPALPTRMHAVDFFLSQAADLGCVGAEAIPRLPVNRGDGGYCVIHPFSGSPRKNWPLDCYRAVAERLPCPVRWCAGPSEALDGAIRFDDLWDLAQWIAGARLYIGNDSGITHLAAATGTPVIAVFQASDPAVWAPRGDHVRVLENPSVDELLAEANRAQDDA